MRGVLRGWGEGVCEHEDSNVMAILVELLDKAREEGEMACECREGEATTCI
jgi:hypothetical protein